MLNIDKYGLDFHLGEFSLYINTPSKEDPGSFSIHLPIPFVGVIVMGWEKSMGWDIYRMTAETAELLRWIAGNCHKGVDVLKGMGEEPTDADLAALEVAMSIEKLMGDN